jgi:flotillin
VQSVSDDVDYLRSLGRKQIALILRDAEMAESNALTEAEQIEAKYEEESSVAGKQDQILILEGENELRKLKARLDQKAKSEEAITVAAGEERQAKAEQILQALRTQLEQLRLEAELVLPAEADRQAAELRSRGNAAIVEENAKAAALVNDMLSQVWQNLGSDASELFMLQQIEMVLKQATQIPQRLKLNQVNVIDNGDGKATASLVRVYPEMIATFLKQVDENLGVKLLHTKP